MSKTETTCCRVSRHGQRKIFSIAARMWIGDCHAKTARACSRSKRESFLAAVLDIDSPINPKKP